MKTAEAHDAFAFESGGKGHLFLQFGSPFRQNEEFVSVLAGILFFVGVVRSFTRSLASSPFRILLGFEETSANIEIQINCPLQEKKSQVKFGTFTEIERCESDFWFRGEPIVEMLRMA